ncbi:hypothetical protein AB6Q85_003304 [Vibrio cholerae]
MTKLLNKELTINPRTLTCSIEELQIKIEQENKEKAFQKFIKTVNTAKESNQSDTLPSYNNLLTKVYLEAKSYWDEQYTANITTKAKKKAIWNNLIKPVNEAYNTIIEEDHNAKNYTTEPRDLVPYLAAQEMLSPLFHNASVQVLEVTNKIVKRITLAYRMNRVEEDTNDPLIFGVLEFIRSISVTSSILETVDSGVLEEESIQDLKRGNHFLFRSEVATQIINSLDSVIADSKNIFEPMVVPPIKHKNLHDKDGGYLTVNSELNKRFYGNNTNALVFNSTTNPTYFEVKNAIQETAYSVNNNLLDFLDKINGESPKLLRDHLLFDVYAEKKELYLISKENKAVLKELRKEEKAIWKEYYKSKAIVDSVKSKIEEQGAPTEAQLKKVESLVSHISKTLTECNVVQKKIELALEPINEAQSRLSKAQANRRTLDIAVKYKEFQKLYLPIFVGANDRTYYYTSDFQPQGNNLCKSLISFADAYRMDEEGFESFKFCFGTLFEGMSKKTRASRIKAVEDNHDAIIDFIERRSNRFLSLIDSDELFTGISFAIEYYNHLTKPDYKTKVICYVDSCSSAVQIQGLTQRCEQCLTLTSVINPTTDTLADAYLETAIALKESSDSITTMSDAELMQAIDSLF